LPPLDIDKTLNILREFARKRRKKVELILVGGLALGYYGLKGRHTLDIDAEVAKVAEPLINFLKLKRLPADIGENFGRWSTIDMPTGYRRRAKVVLKDKYLVIKVLHPVDFIIAKLRRASEEDFQDASFVARKNNISTSQIRKSAESAVKRSPKDTSLFIFKKTVEIFLKQMRGK